MILFQTSSPCDNNVPEGVDLPCIFFEGNGFVENLRRYIGPSARLAVVPADPDSFDLNDEMAETFAACFEYHGIEITDMMLLDARSEEDAEEIIRSSDILLLGGGHVPTENRFFQKIGLKWLLKDYPGVVMGVSAGSMNCARIVYAQPEEKGESIDPDYRRFIPGLGLTDVMILPHYQKVKDYILDGKRLYEDITFADSFGREFIAIPDGSYVLTIDDVSMLYGEGYRVADGEIEQICEDEECVEL